jgi:hypothetical protein
MANIGLLTADVTHNAATSTRDALVAGGHTVTLIVDTAVGTHDFSGYGLIVTARGDNTNRAAIATKLQELSDAGKPLILGPVETGGSSTYDGVPTVMGLTGQLTSYGSEAQLNILNNTHPITTGFTTGAQTFFASNNSVAAVNSATQFIGTRLADGVTSSLSNKPALLAIPPGTYRRTSGITMSGIVMFPVGVLTGAYTTAHQTLLLQSVDWVLANNTRPNNARTEVPKLAGYAVLDYPAATAGTSKLTGYAVLDVPHQRVYNSKIVAYAVMKPEGPTGPIVGNVLGYQGDTWDHAPTSFSVQWQRDGVDIPGATAATYTLVAADAGKMIRLAKIGVNAFGQSARAYSTAIGPVGT